MTYTVVKPIYNFDAQEESLDAYAEAKHSCECIRDVSETSHTFDEMTEEWVYTFRHEDGECTVIVDMLEAAELAPYE